MRVTFIAVLLTAGCATSGPDPTHAAGLTDHIRLEAGAAVTEARVADSAVTAYAIVKRFAAKHGWSDHVSVFFDQGVEIFATQAALWSRVQALHGLSGQPLPTKGLAAALEKHILLAVSPTEYRRVHPEYSAAEGAWERVLAHEIAHRLHVAILAGDEDAMGPVWFYEGFAVVVSGDLKSAPVDAATAWENTKAKGAGSYHKYAAALRFFSSRVPLRELVANAGRKDFHAWLRARLDSPQVP